MRNATGILHRLFGIGRSACLAASRHPAYLLTSALLLIPHASYAQSKAEWDQIKVKCGIDASTAYNDWVNQGCPCNKSTGGTTTTTPAVSGLTPQQQLAMQGAALGGYMIGQGLHQLLFGTPATNTPSPPPDPVQQQRELAAQQLNNSGLYLLKQKNYAGAINEFQKALAIIPNDAGVLHNLALAKQKLKETAIAGQTSGSLGQFLGAAPGNTSTLANPNASALSLVDIQSDPNVVDLRGATRTSVDPQGLKGQLDEVLSNPRPVPSTPGSQVVQPQDKDMELLSTLSQSGASPSQVVQPQDKDMELLGFPAPSSGSNANNGKLSAPATASNVGNNSALNTVQASAPRQTAPASDPSLRDAVSDRPTQASPGGITNAFGTASNPSNPDLNSSAPAPAVAVHSGYDQLSSAANSGIAATTHSRSDAAKAELSCVFDKSACATPAPVAVNRAVLPTPSAPADLQIPSRMLNDPEVRMLNRYKQQAQDAHKAAAAAQATLEAEQKKDPNSNHLAVLQEKAKEAQDKAASQDNIVKFQTGEVQKKIKFTTINTGGDGSTNP